MARAEHYNINVRLGEFDGEKLYEATIRELPDVAEYSETYAEAYALAIDTIKTTQEIMAEKGRSMPKPYIPETHHSGRITLRLPKSLHNNLVIMAENDKTSLNQYLLCVLSSHVGRKEAHQSKPNLNINIQIHELKPPINKKTGWKNFDTDNPMLKTKH